VLTTLSRISAELGFEIRRFSGFTPIDSASQGSIAFSMSRYAQYPAKKNDSMRQRKH
jgi:hypothetical protein